MSGMQMRFGDALAEGGDIVVRDNSTLEVLVPAATGPTGSVPVTLLHPDGQTATGPSFLYVGASSEVYRISPATGPSSGGTEILIAGRGLLNVTEVGFGGVFVSPQTEGHTDEELRILSPAGAGLVAITLRITGGTDLTIASAFTYSASPTVHRVVPAIAPATLVSEVTIRGANLGDITGGVPTVLLDGVEILVNSLSAGRDSVKVAIPPTIPGPHILSVENPDGQIASTMLIVESFAPPSTPILTPSGVPLGGGVVELSCSNTPCGFDAGMMATLGLAPAVAVGYIDGDSLAFRAAAVSQSNAIDLTLHDRWGQSATPVEFYYFFAPTIASVQPDWAPPEGGVLVAINGTGFQSGAQVFWNGVALATESFSETQLIVIVPSGTVNDPVQVEICNPDQGCEILPRGLVYEAKIIIDREDESFDGEITSPSQPRGDSIGASFVYGELNVLRTNASMMEFDWNGTAKVYRGVELIHAAGLADALSISTYFYTRIVGTTTPPYLKALTTTNCVPAPGTCLNDSPFFFQPLLDKIADNTANGTNYSISPPNGTAVGDFNGDNTPDIAIASYGKPNQFLVGLNVATYFYQIASSIDLPDSQSEAAIVADINGDGASDVLFVGATSLYLSSIAADFNTWPSAATASVWPLGGGSFKSTAAAFGDLDDDGDIDILVGTDSGIVAMRNNDGSFATETQWQFPDIDYVQELKIADMDGDGRLDVIVADAIGPSTDGKLKLFFGTFDGLTRRATATEFVPGTFAGPITSLSTSEFDFDGDAELFVTTKGGRDRIIVAGKTEKLELISNVDSRLNSIVGDIGGLPGQEIISTGKASIYTINAIEAAQGTVNVKEITTGFGVYYSVIEPLLIDTDDDLDLDLLVIGHDNTGGTSNPLTYGVIENNAGTLEMPTTWVWKDLPQSYNLHGQNIKSASMAHVESGYDAIFIDVVVRNYGTLPLPALWVAQGPDLCAATLTDWPEETSGFTWVDHDGDGEHSILYLANGSPHLVDLSFSGTLCDTDFAATTTVVENALPPSLVSTLTFGTADLDGDGDEDLVAGGTSQLVYLENIGSSYTIKVGGFVDSDTDAVKALRIADINNDSFPDILVITFDKLELYLSEEGKRFRRVTPQYQPYASGWPGGTAPANGPVLWHPASGHGGLFWDEGSKGFHFTGF